MATYYTIAEVEHEAGRRIENLPGSSYVQGAVAPDGTALPVSWRQSGIPLTAARGTEAQRHLLFSVSIERADARPGDQSAGLYQVVDGDLSVVFWFRIRPGSALTDYRSASDAAADVLAALTAAWPGVDLRPVVVWSPGPVEDSWMPVALRFGVSFGLSLTPRRA